MFLNSLFLDYSYLQLPLNKAEEGNNTGGVVIYISSNPSLLSRGHTQIEKLRPTLLESHSEIWPKSSKILYMSCHLFEPSN